MEGFLETNQELAVCQILGHSYDLDAKNLWGTMEEICAAIAAREDVWPCTNLELVRYLKAMEQAVISEDAIMNRSNRKLWFAVDGNVLSVEPGQRLQW